MYIYEEDDDFIYYPYIKRNLSELSFSVGELELTKYYDIISSWYYGGPLVSSKKVSKKTCNNFIKRFDEYCIESNIVSEFIRYDAMLKNHRHFSKLNPEFNRKTVHVNLEKDLDEIKNNFTNDCIGYIKKAEREGFDIWQSNNDMAINNFMRVYEKRMEEYDAGGHYIFSKEKIKKLRNDLGDKFVLFILLKIDGRNTTPIGGVISLREDGIVNEFLRATEKEYWDYGVNNFLVYKEIEWFKEEGEKIFDMQGGRENVFKFKRSFSNTISEFFLSKNVHKNEIYNILKEKVKSLDKNLDDDYFPIYRSIGE